MVEGAEGWEEGGAGGEEEGAEGARWRTSAWRLWAKGACVAGAGRLGALVQSRERVRALVLLGGLRRGRRRG